MFKGITMKKLLLLVLVFAAVDSVHAAKKSTDKTHFNHIIGFDFAYYPPTNKGLGTTGFAPVTSKATDYKEIESRYPATVDGGRNDIGSPMGIEAKLYYTFQTYIPAMRKDNMLMNENNIKINVIGNLSPVSFETGVYAEITPLAFLIFELGTKIGTGWNFPALGLNGLAINDPNFKYSETNKIMAATKGVLSVTKLQTTLQFDVGAVVPGDWNHFIMAIVENVEYQYFSGAKNNQFWRWEHDAGENQNGFMWYQTFLIGYMMPKVPYLDLVGFLIETEQRVTSKKASTMASGGWGSDFMSVYFGPLLNFEINDKYSITLLGEFTNARQYTDETMGNRYFEKRKINTSSPSYVQFYRIALSFRATI